MWLSVKGSVGQPWSRFRWTRTSHFSKSRTWTRRGQSTEMRVHRTLLSPVNSTFSPVTVNQWWYLHCIRYLMAMTSITLLAQCICLKMILIVTWCQIFRKINGPLVSYKVQVRNPLTLQNYIKWISEPNLYLPKWFRPMI